MIAGKKHTGETRLRAKALFIEEKQDLATIARLVGVPTGTLKRWCAGEGWVQTRDDKENYRELVAELKTKALRAALNETTPENISAWATVQRAYPEKSIAPRQLKREEALRTFDAFTVFLGGQRTTTAFTNELERLASAWFLTLVDE